MIKAVTTNVKVTIDVTPTWYPDQVGSMERVVRCCMALVHKQPLAALTITRKALECVVYAPIDTSAGGLQKLTQELCDLAESTE